MNKGQTALVQCSILNEARTCYGFWQQDESASHGEFGTVNLLEQKLEDVEQTFIKKYGLGVFVFEING